MSTPDPTPPRGETTRPIRRPTLRPPPLARQADGAWQDDATPGPVGDPWQGEGPCAIRWHLSEFSQAHRGFDAPAFTARYPTLLIVVRWLSGHGPESGGSFETLQDIRLTDLARSASGPRIFPLSRRGAHDFDFVTLGRAENNDIVVSHHAISKCHAIFRERDGRWTISDTGTTNGTEVDGALLGPRQPTAIDNGTHLVLGQVLEAEILAAATVHQRYVA